ncbi:hypothetical protein AB4289_14290 [Vibrio cyclitrophicus]
MIKKLIKVGGIRVLSVIASLVFTLYLTRNYSSEKVGEYQLVFNLCFILSQFSIMGVGNWLIKELGKSDKGIDNYSFKALLTVIFLSAIVCVLSYIPITNYLISKNINIYPSLVLLVVLQISISNLIIPHYQGKHRVNVGLLLFNIVQPTVFIILSSVFSDLYLSLVMSFLAINVVFIFLLLTNECNIKRFRIIEIFSVIKTTKKFNIAQLLTIVTSNLAVFLGAYYVSLTELAYLTTSIRVATFSVFFLTIINYITAPRYSEIYSNHPEKLRNYVVRYNRIIYILTIPSIAMLYFLNEYILVYFGGEYVNASNMLSILIIGYGFNALTGSVGYLLLMTGNERDVIFSNLISLIPYFFILIYHGHFDGEHFALLITLSMCMKNLYNLVSVRVRLGFWSFVR